MKYLLRNSGIILMLLGVVFLILYATQGMVSNTYLVVSALLLIGGAVVYVVMQRIMS